LDAKIIFKEIKMENNEVKKEESAEVVETPVTTETEAPVSETPAAPEQPANPLIDATVKELSDKMGFR
jgi:hypothetical protein